MRGRRETDTLDTPGFLPLHRELCQLRGGVIVLNVTGLPLVRRYAFGDRRGFSASSSPYLRVDAVTNLGVP